MENTNQPTETPLSITESKEPLSNTQPDKEKILGLVGQKEFTPYIGAMIYGVIENARAMGFHSIKGGGNLLNPETISRATEGVKMFFDQHTGDGTIVSLGFIGADVLLLMADKVSKKLGKKGFEPTVRFLSSLTFGTALATYLETTEIMNNTIDIPGDLFGVALGTAFILTTKIASDRITTENIEKAYGKTADYMKTKISQLEAFSKKLEAKLGIIDTTDTVEIEALSTELVALVEHAPKQMENT